MPEESQLITGPTPLPDPVRAALGTQMVSHRSEAFRAVVREVVGHLAEVFGGPARVLPFTGSGTAGMEAALVNTLAPGQRVVAVSTGYFGDRFAEIARAFGLDVEVLATPWGQAADPVRLSAVLRRGRPVAAVLLTHNETSTGVRNPIEELCRVVRSDSDALILVDVVSALGAVPLRMREWGIDVAVGVPQKALMSPPGLALLGISERALTVGGVLPRYYFAFDRMAAAVAEGTTTYTPAISVFYALRAALRMIRKEGLEEVFRRHERTARWYRETMAGLGLELFAHPDHRSPTVTALLTPSGVSAEDLRSRLEREHRVFVAGGRGKWKDQMIRVGHMGGVQRADLTRMRLATAEVLRRGPLRDARREPAC